MKSLRLRLILLLCLALSLTWSCAAWLSHIEARREVDKLFDAQLAQSAQVLLGTAGHELHERMEHGKDEPPPLHEYEQKIAFQIWYGSTLLLSSAAAPKAPLAGFTPGYSNTSLAGQPWRVLTRIDKRHGFVIQVAEPLAQRENLVRHIALRMFLPSLAALPLLAIAVWLAVGAGLLPLSRLQREIAKREADRLDPVPMQGVPDEVAPLAAALNELFERLHHAFESERRFTSDAAHELRTPLAALKIQAQVAMRASDDAERNSALKNVLHGVNRATHLVEQLLTLARVDPDVAAGSHQSIELRSLAATVLADIAPLAQASGIELGLEDGPPCTVKGDAAQLSVLLRNLVDNAIRYTPAGGRASVAVRRDGTTILEVQDTGPGIPVDDRGQALERFYRLPGSKAEGSGLGLSIVRRIVELHHAKLELADGPQGQGLLVRVIFPF